MSRTLTRITAVVTLLAAVFAIEPALAQANASSSAVAFESAMRDYEAQRFGKAFDTLALLADSGHAEAARIALLMSAQGPRLYGRRFELHPQRRERWLDSAAAGDRRVAGSP
jgi:hypothetical protein